MVARKASRRSICAKKRRARARRSLENAYRPRSTIRCALRARGWRATARIRAGNKCGDARPVICPSDNTLLVRPRYLTARFDPKTSARIARMVKKGVNAAVAKRFQSRINIWAADSALAVFPIGGVLKLLRRQEGWHKHFAFVVSISNVVWLIALVLLPVAMWNARVAGLIIFLATYGFLAAGYFAFYRERTRLRTTAKFVVFAIADLIITFAVQLPSGRFPCGQGFDGAPAVLQTPRFHC